MRNNPGPEFHTLMLFMTKSCQFSFSEKFKHNFCHMYVQMTAYTQNMDNISVHKISDRWVHSMHSKQCTDPVHYDIGKHL